MNKILSLVFVFISSTAFAEDGMTSLQAAQKAYIAGDGASVMSKLKEALMYSKNHPFMVKNAMILYQAAIKNSLFLQNASPDWQLPKEIDYLTIQVRRNYNLENGKVRFLIAASTGIPQGQKLVQLQVIRFPDKILIDKAANVGYPSETSHDPKRLDIWIGSESSSQPIEEGLYLLNIQLQGQSMTQAWFFISNKNSSSSPVLVSPTFGQKITTTQPEFKWKSFQSPEHQANEKTTVRVKITAEGADEESMSAMVPLDRNSFRVGDLVSLKDYIGTQFLSDGKYWTAIVYRDEEDFRGLGIQRISETRLPFEVQLKQK